MPHSAGLLRAVPACLAPRRPSRPAPARLARVAAAAQDHQQTAAALGSNSSSSDATHHMEAQHDGTTAHHFGAEAEEAVVAARSTSPPAAAQHARRASAHSGVAVLGASHSTAAAHLADLLHQSPPSSSSSEEEGGPSTSGSTVRHHYYGQQQQQAAHAGLNGAVVAPLGAQQHTQQQQQQHLQSRPPPRGQDRKRQPHKGRHGSDYDPSLAAADAHSVGDYSMAPLGVIVATYDALCNARILDEALLVVKECVRAGRADALGRLKHYRFLRPAAAKRSVAKALRFVQLLPRQYADARTYNMLLKVCADAGDLRNALHTADMLRAAGLKMDAILYTTLISACAAAGDAEQAFAQYAQMKADGVAADKMVYATVIKACAETIDRLPPSERRQRLVLLERAFALVDDAKAARVPTDAAVWNVLVTASGRAGQLQRAFNVLEDMLASGARPNDRTYASVMDACGRAGDLALALRIYRKAQREGCGRSLMIYSAAVHACLHARGGCDSAEAMNIYADMQRAGVEPDNQFYGMLMKAAGAHGDLEPVLGLQAEMEREGLHPCAGTNSALMTVFVHNGRLSEAQQIYRSLRAERAWPHLYAMNALLNAYANRFRLGDVVSLVCEMAEGGLKPDAFTFSAIFNACQRADEAELALDVARLMKLHKVSMDETHAVIMLRMCYNRLRQTWVPGGYPPHRPDGPAAGSGAGSALPGMRRTHERQRLLEALTPRGRRVELRETPEVAWLAQAFGIYREAVAAGVKPSMRMLNRVLMCLRVAWEGGHPDTNADAEAGMPAESLLHHQHPSQLGSFGARGASAAGGDGLAGGSLAVPKQEKIGVESVYHVQAVSILEEAIISNVVPSFKIDSDEPIDLRGMPPAVAEVYVLTVLSALQRLCEARRVINQNILFLVPEYDGFKVFMPSHLSHIDYERIPTDGSAAAATTSAATPRTRQRPSNHLYDDSDDEERGVTFADVDAAFARAAGSAAAATAAVGEGASAGNEKTGLGVAGVMRRLRLWAREYGERGFILLEAKELTRWCKAMQRAVERRSASALPVQKPYGQATLQPGAKLQPGATRLQQQQHHIRQLGLGPFGNTTHGSV